MADTKVTFDQLFQLPKVTAKKPIKAKAPITPQPIQPPAGLAAVKDEQTQAAFLAASDAASNVIAAIAHYKQGSISKVEANAIFNDYQSKISTLEKLDPARAQHVQDSVTGTKATTPVTQTTPATTTATPATQPQGLIGNNQGTTIPTSGTTTPAPTTTPTKPKKTTGTGSGGTGKKTTPPPPVLTQQDFLTKYATTLAFIQSDPSLTKLFNDASKGNWTPQKFQAQLQQTDWAHRYSAAAQQQELARTQSPSTFGQSWNNMRNLIATTAVSLGLNIRPQDIGNELKPSGMNGVWKPTDVPRQDGTITQWALEHANDQNFQQELQQHLTTVGNINLNMPGGTAGSDIQSLKQYASSMGLLGYQLPSATDPNNPNAKGMDYFSSAAQSILLGKSDLETWKADLLNTAKGRYKAFASSLDAGQTVQNLAAPYINTLANLLEISPDKVDLSSPTGYGKMVNDALMGTDATNQQPMTLTDFEKQIKARPEWGFTNNARDTVMPGVDTLLKTLGKVS